MENYYLTFNIIMLLNMFVHFDFQYNNGVALASCLDHIQNTITHIQVCS